MVLTARENEQIKAAVVHGNRPPLDAISGPSDLVSFATHWISQCWHQLTDQRPSFHGIKRFRLSTQICRFSELCLTCTV